MKRIVTLAWAAVSLAANATADCAQWISPVGQKAYLGPVKNGARAMPGNAWFVRSIANGKAVVSAKWTTTALGVYEIYVNGRRVGDEFLKPGFTHVGKTRYSFSHDVTALMNTGAGESNVFAAEVGAGWWRDKIVTPTNDGGGFYGKKSAFRGMLEVKFADGSVERYGTDTENWKAGIGGPVVHSAIFDGEEYDARVPPPYFGENLGRAEANDEFKGTVYPSCGAEVYLRKDLALKPVKAYAWKGVTGAGGDRFGKVKVVRNFNAAGAFEIGEGETLVVDFAQNASAVPSFRFRGAEGTVLTALPAEMLNDGNGEKKRGNDGPEGSVYRVNLRKGHENGRLVKYVFSGKGTESYMPRFTFFGYRYISLTATAPVVIEAIESVPVSSIRKDDERGFVETGDEALNRFVKNVYWGQLSNYLSVPTDCPQRNERLGWAADTQVFAESAMFNADVGAFLRKWMRDMRDSRCAEGGFPSVAPYAQYGNETFSLGWADAGVIVPWTVWRHSGDESILRDNWEAMVKFVRRLDETKYDFEGKLGFIYADWLSYETFETCGNRFGSWAKWKNDPDAMNYRRYLAACYWLYDARLMVDMAEALGKSADAAWFRASAERALGYIRGRFLEEDGLLLKPMRHLQTANVFALKHGIVQGDRRQATKELLLRSIRENGDCLQTGFLGTSFIMDALSGCGAADVAYTLLLQHKNPSWLYSVDQGATTVWERWNSYTKKDGFGPVDMNSFNHYAYGAVLGWVYRVVAGISADSKSPGFRRIVMAPKPDVRLGWVKAEYRSAAGLIKSAWRYAGGKWIWEFTVPDGAIAEVAIPGESSSATYSAGSYRIERPLK